MSDSTKSAKKELNAFEELMNPKSKKQKTCQSTDEPIYMAVIYIRWLLYIDPNEPLFGCPYVGQSVRAGNTAIEVADLRWKAENNQAVREDKDIGLLHFLGFYGAGVFKNKVVEWKRGPRSEVQKWANEREISLIAAYGGPLKDPLTRCKQTLNLTKGGKGKGSFESKDALRTVAWIKFVSEMNAYVDFHGNSLVPFKYTNVVSGCRLGEQLTNVRKGILWKGHPDESKRKEWLESLPGWAWNSRDTIDFKEKKSECAKAQWINATPEERSEWSRKQSEAHSTPEYTAAASERGKAQAAREAAEGKTSLGERGKATQFGNWTEEQRATALAKRSTSEANKVASERAKAQFASPEARAELSERSKAQAAREAADGKPSLAKRGQTWRKNATTEQLAEWSRKQLEAKSNPEFKAAASERGKKQAAREAAEGKTSLGERGKATQFGNWTEEQRAAAIAKKIESNAKKRADKLSKLTGLALERKKKEYERTDCKEMIRKAKADALLKLDKYATMDYQWRYRNVGRVQKEEGVVFKPCPCGVWCAEMKTQNAVAGSSSGTHTEAG